MAFNQWAVSVSVVLMVCVLEEEVSCMMYLVQLQTKVLVNSSVCRGIEGDSLQPAEVPKFSGCTIVNGSLIFNSTTDFM